LLSNRIKNGAILSKIGIKKNPIITIITAG